MPPNKYLSLLYLLLLLLPIAIIMWRKGPKERFLKHALVWAVIILLLFLCGKMLQSLGLPQREPAYPLASV